MYEKPLRPKQLSDRNPVEYGRQSGKYHRKRCNLCKAIWSPCGRGSTTAQNEILGIIDSSNNYETFVRRLNNCANHLKKPLSLN